MPRADPALLIDDAPLDETLRGLARRGEVRSYRRGTLLIEEGDVGDTLFILLTGRLRAFSRHPTNGREITYGVYGAGEYIGEMGLDGGPRSASVEVVQAATVVRVGRAQLLAHLAEHPDFALALLSKVIRRARAATLSLQQIALNDVYGRVKLLLESSAGSAEDGLRVCERLSHREMAERLGCGREMVSRVMKDLERGGYLRPEAGRLVLLRPLPMRW